MSHLSCDTRLSATVGDPFSLCFIRILTNFKMLAVPMSSMLTVPYVEIPMTRSRCISVVSN